MFDIQTFGGDAILERIEVLCHAIEADPGARLPVARRFTDRKRIAESGNAVPDQLYQELLRRANAASAASAASDHILP